jgi:Zn-dependent M16 (insulinase) family peptidase
LVVAGKITPTALLSVLQKEVEPSIIAHGQAQGPSPKGWKRPWLETPSKDPPVIAENKVHAVEFPEEDESVGEVEWRWVGPAWRDYVTEKALDILATYLADSPVSPLYRELVEIKEPFCTGMAGTAQRL